MRNVHGSFLDGRMGAFSARERKSPKGAQKWSDTRHVYNVKLQTENHELVTLTQFSFVDGVSCACAATAPKINSKVWTSMVGVVKEARIL